MFRSEACAVTPCAVPNPVLETLQKVVRNLRFHLGRRRESRSHLFLLHEYLLYLPDRLQTLLLLGRRPYHLYLHA
ncbi:MAG: hypothetical protein Q9181_000124 [Wetmoreana brouardii]